MQQHGFIHDMLDVKVLILFVASKALYPLSLQKIYELCFQDDCLSYFDVSVAVPQMVESGHLEKTGEDEYVITDKGRERAQYIFERHMCLTKMFTRLGVNAETAAEDACKAEHILSEQTLEKIRESALRNDAAHPQAK